MKNLFLLIVAISFVIKAQVSLGLIDTEFKNGNFSKATELIKEKIAKESLTDLDRYNLLQKIEIMDRIRLDFKRTEEDVKRALAKYYNPLTDEMLSEWIKEKSLEMMMIDGKKMFFNRAVPNLFRINKEAKLVKERVDGIQQNKLSEFLQIHIPAVVKESENSGEKIVKKVKNRVKYRLTVNPNVIPDGEILRCWIPYPKEIERQKNINLIKTNIPNYVIADKNSFHRSIYLEKAADKDKATEFYVEYEYDSYSYYNRLDFNKEYKIDINNPIFSEYTKERYPHIQFTDEIKELSKKIIGNEKSTIKKVKLIFEWIDKNIPWASAREYSTMENIPMYAIENKHGDCGMVSLLFITLCRYNGIPAKWQSGWMTHPVEVNLHDWSEIYLDELGWIPVDQSFGMQPSDLEKEKYFYLGSIDSYRLVANDDFSNSFYPSKIYPRSETVDFQRGEVEWRGGNLYFDKWDYNMDIEYDGESEK